MDDSMTRDSGSERAIVVSNDTHIGPRLVEDLREYCPSSYLEEFDRFAATTATARAAAEKMLRGSGYLDHPNLQTLGHHDPAGAAGRLRLRRHRRGRDLPRQHEHGTGPVHLGWPREARNTATTLSSWASA